MPVLLAFAGHAPATAAPQIVDLNVTLDWRDQPRLVLEPAGDAWAIDRADLGEDFTSAISISVTPGPDSHVVVEANTRVAAVVAPDSFDFAFSDAPTPTTTYRVHVEVTNRADSWPGPAPANPTIRDAFTNEDLGALWDGGHPLLGYHGKATNELVYVTGDDELDGSYVQSFYRVHDLNEQMATYFQVTIPDSLGDRTSDEDYVRLAKRRGAPPLPPAYWTQPWFEIGYTVFGTVDDGSGSPRDFSEEHTVTFGEPRWDLITRSSRTRYYAEAGATSGFSIIPDGRGVASGSFRVQTLDLPRSLTRRFEVIVVNPEWAHYPMSARIQVRPRTAKAAAARATLVIPYVGSVLTRSGERVYSAPQTITFRPTRH